MTAGLVFAQSSSAGLTTTEKPRLEISEVVIETSAPALMDGRKDPVTVLETQNAAASISDTLKRLPGEAPDQILLPDEPFLERKSGCLIPFAVFGGSAKSRLIKASRAWEKMDWREVIAQLTPIIEETPPPPEKPEALYFIGRSKHYLNDIPGAQDAYQTLWVDYPQHPLTEYALYSLGWLFFEAGEPERALELIGNFDSQYAASPLTPYIRYLRASIYNSMNRYREALLDLEGIIAGYPMFPDMDDVQFWTAENQFFLNRYDTAISNYNLYINNYPDGDKRVEALYGRAFCYLEMQQIDQALADFRTIVTQHPEHKLAGEAGFQGGKLAISMETLEGSAGFFEQALQTYRADSPKRQEAQAWMDYEAKRFMEAAGGFAGAAASYAAEDPEALPVNPNRAEMLFMEALSLLRNGNYQPAADKFDFLARIPDSKWTAAAQANAGIAWLMLDRLEPALERLRSAVSSETDIQGKELYSLYTAEIMFRVKRYDESLQLFRRLEATSRADSFREEVIRGIAWNYYAMQDWEQAATEFGRMIEQFPGARFFAEAILRRAESRFNMGQYDLAKDDFQRLIEEFPLHPESFEARLLDARADWIRGEYQTGMNGLRDALRFAPAAAQRQIVRMTIGDLFQEQGRFQEAVEEFHQAYLEDPAGTGAPGALLKKADNLYNQGEYSGSADVYREVINRFSESESAALAQYSIGLIYLRQDRLEDYLRECRSIAASRPGTQQSALALNGAASILIEQNRFKDAIDILQTLRDRYFNLVDQELIRFRLGQCYEAIGSAEDAEKEYQGLIELSPTGRYAADATMMLGEMAIRRLEYAKAATLFETVIDHFPFHPRRLDAITRAAFAHASLNRWDQAERLWDRFIKEAGMSGQVFDAHLELGRIKLMQGELDQAAAHAETASRSTERRVVAGARYLESEIQEKKGDIDQALKGYLKIGYMFPEQSETVFESHLSAIRILIDRGRSDQAGNLIEKADSLAVSPEQQQRLSSLRLELRKPGGLE